MFTTPKKIWVVGAASAVPLSVRSSDSSRSRPLPSVAQVVSRREQALALLLAVQFSLAVVWQRLAFLDLGFMLMRCGGTTSLSAALHGSSSLQTLLLGGNDLAEQGLTAIADMVPSLPALQHLSLHANNLDTACARALAGGLVSCRTLEKLVASWCVISDVGILALSAVMPAC